MRQLVASTPVLVKYDNARRSRGLRRFRSVHLLKDSSEEGEAVRLSDAVDVIHWYCIQIGAKSARALSTLLEEGPYASDEDLYDANGSTKVALLGIERSRAAWMLLSRMAPEEKASIRPHVARLQRLRLQLGDLFPNARAFTRPGFDTSAE